MDSSDAVTADLPFDSVEQEVYLNLWRTYDRLKAIEDRLFGQVDLTAQQYNALRILDAAAPRGAPTLELAAQLVTRAPDITRLVDKLERRGLVARRRRRDNRRFVEVAVTAAGSALLADLRENVLRCHREQLGHLGRDEARLLTDLLRKARRPHEPNSARPVGVSAANPSEI